MPTISKKMAIITPHPFSFSSRIGTVFLWASALLLLALTATFHLSGSNDARVIDAQTSETIQISPSNFITYFDIDATTQIATLKSGNKSDKTFVFAEGDYTNPIHIIGAENVTLRGANPPDSDRAANIKANKIIEVTSHSNRAAVLGVQTSTNVTIDRFNFDFSCVHDADADTNLYGIYFWDSSGAITNNILNSINAIPSFPTSPFEGTTEGCGDLVTGSTAGTLMNIRVQTTSTYAPMIDENGKVTNLLPIRISGNEIKQAASLAIGVYGYFDATISDNAIESVATAIQLTGGASGTVSGNTISTASAGIAYSPNWFLPNSPADETVEAHLEIRGNDIRLASLVGISLGFGWCASADGTRVNANVEVIGNYIHENQRGSASSSAIQIASCAGSEDERIKAKIIGNTLEEDPPNPQAIGIFAATSFNSGTSAEAWFEIEARYNEIVGYAIGVRITNQNAGSTFGVNRAVVDASYNYWGTGNNSPAHLIDDVIQDPEKAGVTYDSWLSSPDLAGRHGAYGTGMQQLQAHHFITKLEPNLATFTILAGKAIRLSITSYGDQDIEDTSLIDGETEVNWTVEGASGEFREAIPSLDNDDEPNDREVVFTAPKTPGEYKIHATLATCRDPDIAGCRATFTAKVRRRATPATSPAPRNPSGHIPSILTDSGGAAYSVFTPEEGGSFIGDGFSISAPPGAVPNGELVGLKMVRDGDASNVGSIHQRYTLGGGSYRIDIVDAGAEKASEYRLVSFAEACVPLPEAFRANISDVALVTLNEDDTLAVLTSKVRLSSDGIELCGRLSSLPAVVAAGAEGSPQDFSTPVPASDVGSPDTGGSAPALWVAVLALLLGATLAVTGPALAYRRRRMP